MKRINSQNILDWKERRGEHRFSTEIANRTSKLEELFRSIIDQSPDLLAYFPVQLVTNLEVYCREAIKEIVDSQPNSIANARTMLKDVRIDLDTLEKFANASLTPGDLIAHSLQFSSFEQVLRVFSAFENSFIEKLKNSHPRWTEEKEDFPLAPIISDWDNMAKNMSSLFDVRHILVHELPSNMPFEPEDVRVFIRLTLEFVIACDWVIVEILHGDVPGTQTQMNISAHERAECAKSAMETALEELHQVAPASLITASQQKWNEFAQKTAELTASNVEGGSMYPMLYAGAIEEMTETRTKQLTQMKNDWLA